MFLSQSSCCEKGVLFSSYDEAHLNHLRRRQTPAVILLFDFNWWNIRFKKAAKCKIQRASVIEESAPTWRQWSGRQAATSADTTTTTVWVELTGGGRGSQTGCVVCYITSHKEGVAVNGLLWTPWFGATFMNWILNLASLNPPPPQKTD